MKSRLPLRYIPVGSPNQFLKTDASGQNIVWGDNLVENNNPFGVLSRDAQNRLIVDNPTDFKIVGGFYYPRRAVNPDWFSEMVRTDIPVGDRLSWTDIEADLDQLVANNINCVRIVLQYNLTTFGTNPMVGASPTYTVDAGKEAVFTGFLDRCRTRNIFVFTQTNFGYEGELFAPDIAEMQAYVDSTLDTDDAARRYNDHIDWLTNILTSYFDVILVHKMFNEPDGFGTWDNVDSALTVLNFLSKIKERFIQGYANIPYVINAVTHVNFNLRFPEADFGKQSLYEISDWAVFNSYYWADNGFFEFTHYRRQFEFMVANNYDNKPLLMTEFGWPSNYDGQGVGEESFIPENGQFDRPLGNNTLMPHTPYMQERGIKEGVFHSEVNDAIGAMCWSLYQHENRTSTPSFFQDSFGLIASDGSITDSFRYLKRAFIDRYAEDGTAPFSITGGTSGGGAHINGDQGFDANDVPAGVYLPQGGGNFSSEPLNYRTPFIISAIVKQLTEPVSNGMSYGIEFVNNGVVRFEFEDFENRWRLFLNNVEVARSAFAGTDPLQNFGLAEKKLSIDMANRFLDFYVDDTKIDFFDIADDVTPYNLQITQLWYLADKKLTFTASTADVQVLEAYYEETIF